MKANEQKKKNPSDASHTHTHTRAHQYIIYIRISQKLSPVCR